MIDAAESANAAQSETKAEGKINQQRPPRPDEKTDPVGLLRWQMTYELKFSTHEVDEHCQRFQEQLDAGLFTFDEAEGKWVKADGI